MIHFQITISGTAPLLMHNARLANPLDPAAKALKEATSKRQKTDEDHEQIARLEHAGGLYLDPDVGPYLPGANIASALWDAAKLSKQGLKIKRGVFITSDVNPVGGYRGPRDVAGLWADENFRHMVSARNKSTGGRTMRCRPIFRDWVVEVDGILDPTVIDLDSLAAIAVTSGQMIGLGDWRPLFGRFEASVVKISGKVAA